MNTIKEIYQTLKEKSNPLQNPQENNEFWAEFGYKIYQEFLADEIEMKIELNKTIEDAKFLWLHLTADQKKDLNKRFKKIYESTK